MSQYVGRALQFGCLMLLLFLSGREAYCVSEASLQGPRTKGTQTPTVVERPVYFQILYACGTFTHPLPGGPGSHFQTLHRTLHSLLFRTLATIWATRSSTFRVQSMVTFILALPRKFCLALKMRARYLAHPTLN